MWRGWGLAGGAGGASSCGLPTGRQVGYDQIMIALLSALAHAQPCTQTIDADAPPQVIPAAELPAVIREQAGCVVLVELYASWCAPCATIDPQVSALVAAHRPAGLVTLGLSVDTNRGAWLQWRKTHARAYAPRVLTDWTLAGLTASFAELGVSFSSAVPFLVLLDAQGEAVMWLSEPDDLSTLDQAISGLLGSSGG